MQNAILLTFFAGIVGTALGGFLGFFINPRSSCTLSYLLSFSCGMMLAMICFDLLPEALENAGVFITILGCGSGVLLLLLFDRTFHHHHEQTTESLDDLHHHHVAVEQSNNKTFIRLGLFMIGSVALHNFPEGLAVGSSSIHELSTGTMMALLLTLHNIPEGMGMIAPLLSGGLTKPKALVLTALSGVSTLLGGFLGSWLGFINTTFIGFSLSFAAGCMYYVTYYEILPQVSLLDKGKRPLLIQLAGFLIGFFIISQMHG